MRTALTALLLVAIACGGGGPTDPSPEPPGPILIRGGDMGAQFENFSLTRDDAPLTDAVVSINETVIPTSASGHYNYQLPSALQPGDELVLRVEAGGDVVEGRATIQAMPTITAPVPGAAATRGDPLTITWTAGQDPDWFQASLGYTADGAGSSVRDSLSGSARQATLQTDGVPATSTNWHVNLFGYLRGSFTGPVDPASSMNVRLAPGSVPLQVGTGAPGLIRIQGGDMGDQYENFSVTRDGAPLTGATVSVNGTVVTAVSSGYYSYALPTPLGPGDELVVRVEDGSDVVEGRATIVAAPVVTSPLADAAVVRGAPLTVAWTMSPDPDWFEVSLGYVNGAGGSSVSDSVAATARQTTITTTSIPGTSTDWSVDLFGYLRGSFTGPVDPGSTMRVRLSNASVPLQVGS